VPAIWFSLIMHLYFDTYYNQIIYIIFITLILLALKNLGFQPLHNTTRNLVVCNQSLCNWLSFATISIMFATTNFKLYKFWAIRLCSTNMQLNVYNMDTCHKNNGLNLYIFKLIYLIYLHKLCIIILCTSNTKVKPMLTKASLN
jgi:hypothetical protein